MTLELTMQAMFNEQPTLFKERADCLNHLFCTIGNGYKWVDGELVDGVYKKTEVRELKKYLVDGKAFQHNKMSLRDALACCWESTMKDIKEKFPDVFDEIEAARKKSIAKEPDDVYHERERKYRWYFYLGGYCTEYAYLFNYPENIKPDWLAGIEECKAMLREDGYDVDSPDENPIDTKANLEETIRFRKER